MLGAHPLILIIIRIRPAQYPLQHKIQVLYLIIHQDSHLQANREEAAFIAQQQLITFKISFANLTINKKLSRIRIFKESSK